MLSILSESSLQSKKSPISRVSMEKGRNVEAEFQLPEVIIQHIQSFLSGKEAAKTTILSKSWCSAWLTRPNLDFDGSDFRDEDVFWKFVKNTVQRYDKLNLKIESLRLWISYDYPVGHYALSLVSELILKAMKMGAIDLDFTLFNSWFALPRDVLGSENLVKLSVNGCKMGLGENGKVSCSRLKSLSLCDVILEDDVIWDIISRCPLIEKLSLSCCEFWIGTPGILALSPFVDFGRNVGSVVNRPISPYVFRKLKCLRLHEVNVHTLFFSDFSSKFPCLKDLDVSRCYGYKGIKISSPSLEFINFTQDFAMLRAKFDVPSIRKFTFLGTGFPSLSFRPTTRNWESDMSITCCYSPSVKCFLKLNKLLTKLSQSKVSLFLKICSVKGFDYAGSCQGLPKPVVENLTIDAPYSVGPALCNSLFQCCRPLFVTHYWYSKSITRDYGFLKMVYECLMHRISLNCCVADESMPSQYDLKEVNVEYFDEAVSVWRIVPSKSLFDDPKSPGAGRKIGFHLRWV